MVERVLMREGCDRLLSICGSSLRGPAAILFIGCGFFAYSWKLPAYSGAFLLTIDNFSFFTYSWSFFAYNFSFFTYSWSFPAYSGKVRLIRALRDCKQRSSTVSKKAPTVSKKASPLFISRDACSDSIAKLVRACFYFIKKTETVKN